MVDRERREESNREDEQELCWDAERKLNEKVARHHDGRLMENVDGKRGLAKVWERVSQRLA